MNLYATVEKILARFGLMLVRTRRTRSHCLLIDGSGVWRSDDVRRYGTLLLGSGTGYLHGDPFDAAFTESMQAAPSWTLSADNQDILRMRAYHVARFAQMASGSKGDYAFFGVRDGVAPGVVCREGLVDFAEGRRMLLVDAWDMEEDGADGIVRDLGRGALVSPRAFDGFPWVVPVADSLVAADGLPAQAIAFAHVDTGGAVPDLDLFRRLQPKLSDGALVVYECSPAFLDDRRASVDALCAEYGFSCLYLPTGQFVLFKAVGVAETISRPRNGNA